MLQVRHRHGRVVTVHGASPLSLDDIAGADRDMRAAHLLARDKVVICADYREMKLLGPTEAKAMISMFGLFNEFIERSAILSSSQSALAVLQLVRILREANNPTRKAFDDPAELRAWLAEILTPDEAASIKDVF